MDRVALWEVYMIPEKMNALFLGGGARECAMAWKAHSSPRRGIIYCSPGNTGMREYATIFPFIAGHNLYREIKERKIDLVVISSESHLAMNLAEDIRRFTGAFVFGPSASLARIETSKLFAKGILARAGVPTARYIAHDARSVFTQMHAPDLHPPYVVKADGLAGGKGVGICHNVGEVNRELARLRQYGNTVLIEEFLQGEEVSGHMFCDGTGADEGFCLLPPLQDRKRLNKLNTGGMAMVGPVTNLMGDSYPRTREQFQRVIRVLREETGEWFNGCLYPGFMGEKRDFGVLEVNARLGDPETQAYMRLLQSDLLELLYACATGTLRDVPLPKWHSGYVVCIVLASRGYPTSVPEGREWIHGIERARSIPGVEIFFAGVEKDAGKWYALGGRRVLTVTAVGETVQQAISRAYSAVSYIRFSGMQFLPDVGMNLLGRI